MNNVVKGTIVIGVFGAGFGAGYLIANKKFEKELDEINRRDREELDAIRRSHQKIRIDDHDDDTSFDDTEEESEKAHDPSKDFTDDIPYAEDPFEGMSEEEIEEARAHHRRVVTDYTACYKKPSIDEVARSRGVFHDAEPKIEDDEPDDGETEEENEIRMGEALGRVNHNAPYIIEPEQFDTECEHYDKIELFYYAKDDTLCDDNDHPVDDYDDVCGCDAIARLEIQTNVYARNEVVGADYAIYRLNRSYSQDVMGIAETPTERDIRRKARRKAIMDGDE